MLVRFAIALATVVPAAASAQSPYDLLTIPDGPVHTLAVVEDTLYFGGDFDFVGPRVGPATALDPTTGEVVAGLPLVELSDASAVRGVGVALADGTGGVFLGGEIRAAGGAPRSGLVHVLADGAVDPAFAPDPTLASGGPGRVDGLVLSDSVLFVMGSFATIAGAARDGFAALDARTGAALPFAPTVAGADSAAYAAITSAVLRDGVVLVAGAFVTIDGVERLGMAALDWATGAVLPWDPALGGGTVSRLFPSDDSVYLLGSFESVGGAPRDGLAEIAYPAATDAGPVLTPWAPAFALDRRGFSYASVTGHALTDDALWLSGTFVEAPGSSPRVVTPLVRFPRATDAAHADPVLIDSGDEGTSYRDGTAVATDGATVWVSTSLFDGFRGTEGYVLGVDAGTLQPTGFRVFTGPIYPQDAGSPQVHALAFLGASGGLDARLVAAGRRLELGGEFAPFYGAVDLTTRTMLPAPAVPFESALREMMPSPDGRRLYYRVGTGSYVEIDLRTGTRTPFTVPYEGGGPVRDASAAPPVGPPAYTAVQNGPGLVTPDRLYLVSETGPSAQRRIRAVDPQTLAPLSTFEVTQGPAVISDLLLADGWLYVSGDFASINGQTHHTYVRVDPETGTPDPTWIPQTSYYGTSMGGPFARLDSLVVTGGDNLLRFLGQTVDGLAAFRASDGQFVPWGGTVDGVRVTALQTADEVLYASGYLISANGQPRRYLAAFDQAGSLLDWPAAQPIREVGLLVSERHQRAFI